MAEYIVSARKYRPQNFLSVVGQKSLVQTLKNAIGTGKLAHAYLFCGPRGVGKTTCARIFAKTINCMHRTADGEACDECESCRSFREQRSYNVYELDAASNNSVDNIRDLIEQVQMAPQIGQYKVFIIDEVHMLSNAAFNAFLKTLEEPPRHAIFILCTTEKQKILPTILSRCQTYDFQRITVQDIVGQLALIAQREGITAEPAALQVIARKADGGMRDALSIFDQIASFTSANVTYSATIDNLNILDYETFFHITDAALAGNIPEALLTLDGVIRRGFDPQVFVGGWAGHLRGLLVAQDPATLSLIEEGPEVAGRYQQQTARCTPYFLLTALQIAAECDAAYRASRNKRLSVELAILRICQLMRPVAGPAQPGQPPLQGMTAPEPQAAGRAGAGQPSTPGMGQPATPGMGQPARPGGGQPAGGQASASAATPMVSGSPPTGIQTAPRQAAAVQTPYAGPQPGATPSASAQPAPYPMAQPASAHPMMARQTGPIGYPSASGTTPSATSTQTPTSTGAPAQAAPGAPAVAAAQRPMPRQAYGAPASRFAPRSSTTADMRPGTMQVGAQPMRPAAAQEEAQAELSEPVDDDGLRMAWNRFIRSIPTQKLLQSAMQSSQPRLSDGTHIEVIAPAGEPAQRIEANQRTIETYLRQQLHNTSLTLSITASAVQSNATRAYTPREKFAKIIEGKQQLFQSLIDHFNLELA